MEIQLYQVSTTMSDGYYSVNDGFRAQLTEHEREMLAAELETMQHIGTLQSYSMSPITDGISFAESRARVEKFIQSYPRRKFGGPGGVG